MMIDLLLVLTMALEFAKLNLLAKMLPGLSWILVILAIRYECLHLEKSD
jgi:hypothetical protein